jgi:hypothetical protein
MRKRPSYSRRKEKLFPLGKEGCGQEKQMQTNLVKPALVSLFSTITTMF